MTERWRKKLGDLDKVGPGDEVFRRAKAGPVFGDEPLPRPRTTTRVVTAVVAFAVFAVAIAVFAIPAFRMRDEVSGAEQLGLFPVWPTQTPDGLHELQRAADAGEASWALDPEAVAMRFGRQVMGWPGVRVLTINPEQCSVISPSSGDVIASATPCPSAGIQAAPGSLSSALAPGFTRFSIYDCDPQRCDSLGPLGEQVTVYQPLGTGAGQIWAVLEASSPGISLSVATGQSVHDGSTLSATFSVGEIDPTLAYKTCGVGAATSDFETNDTSRRSAVQVVLSGGDCSGPTEGYVWATLGSPGASADGSITYDPLDQGAAPGTVSGLAAAPIVALFPSSQPPTSVTAPTVTPTGDSGWVSYADPMGFSLKMPFDWGKTSIQGELILSAPGGEPYVQINRVPNEGFHDDSSFPLDYTSMASDPQPHFYGDGQAFIIQWLTGSDRPPTDQEAAIFDRITRSIAFEPWSEGETRNGWTAAWDGTTTFPKTWPWWISANDNFWFATESGGRHLVYGPVYMCNGASLYTGSDSARITCANNAHGQWDTSGQPASDNTIGFDSPLKSYPAVVSWDGHLLVRFP